jgi:hypothetical protein
MSGDIPPLPNTLSWRGAQLTGTTFIFTKVSEVYAASITMKTEAV